MTKRGPWDGGIRICPPAHFDFPVRLHAQVSVGPVRYWQTIPSSLFLLLRSFKHQPPTAPIPDPSKTLSPASSFVEPDTRLAGETRATENRRMLARDRATLPEIRAPPHRIINNLRRFI